MGPGGRAARPSKADVEAKLEMCTLAAWLATEAEQLMPLPATLMKDKFLDKVASADPVVEVELMSALQIKDDSYKVRDNPTIASILNDNALNVSSGVASCPWRGVWVPPPCGGARQHFQNDL